MAFENQRWFDLPSSLEEARGGDARLGPRARQSEVVAPDGTVIFRITNGGITNPGRRVLAAGTRLVRLSSGGLPVQAMAGSWWMEWPSYQAIEQFADNQGVSLPVAVRLLCCVLLDWNEMTMIVQARLKLPLLAYEGFGAPALQRNPRLNASEYLDGRAAEALNIKQLYIPGLSSPDLRHDCLMSEGYGHLPQDMSRTGYVIRPYA